VTVYLLKREGEKGRLHFFFRCDVYDTFEAVEISKTRVGKSVFVSMDLVRRRHSAPSRLPPSAPHAALSRTPSLAHATEDVITASPPRPPAEHAAQLPLAPFSGKISLSSVLHVPRCAPTAVVAAKGYNMPILVDENKCEESIFGCSGWRRDVRRRAAGDQVPPEVREQER
jgi:hypothetical protein